MSGQIALHDRVASRRPIDGIRIGGSRSEHIVHVEAWRRGHERAMAQHLRRAVRPGMTVVDAGAYLGYFTLVAADRVGREGQVHAFEPHPESFHALCDNVRANGFADRVTPVPMALDERPATRRLRLDDNPTQSALGGHGDATPSVDVQCTTLDRYLAAEAPPDLVKIDVEGGEVAALAGMADTLDRVGEGFVMIIEFNPAALRAAGTSAEELVARVAAAGLRIRVINERSGRIEAPNPRNLFARSWVNLWLSAHGAESVTRRDSASRALRLDASDA